MTTAEQLPPVLYLSHGAPPLADDKVWTRELATWGSKIARPTAILIVSAHWESAPVTVGATDTAPLTYDFWGFAQHYYDVKYPAPGAPDLAAKVSKLLSRPGSSVHQDAERGLDHGAYVPLKEMYPAADIPVLQISMPSLDPKELFEVGRRLAPLRDEGVLIVGSGFTTHNLQRARFGDTSGWAEDWTKEFDHWAAETVGKMDVDSALNFLDVAPAAHLAHPRTEHFAPLFVSLGAASESKLDGRSTIAGYWYGLSKRSFQFE